MEASEEDEKSVKPNSNKKSTKLMWNIQWL